MDITITTTIDVPAGSGLGASSALTVALIEAFVTAMQLPLGPYEVAQLAYDIERRVSRHPDEFGNGAIEGVVQGHAPT